ncbi:Gmc oxidoreductase [Rhizoctonia solani]|uniref:Gmc oxidoreductase n=1 Tax=Rhizoctonia solani TaxID=456999 RepID=A0A8H7M2J1_9AGAM|nr:Gmc oxidoreductase [Rhizoctonia solani]
MGATGSKHVTNAAQIATVFNGDSKKNTVTPEDVASWKKWDYIIVGGGSAGCVLAHRLSEDPNVSVLVIEAGKDCLDQLFSRIPLTFGRLFKTEADWAYTTKPQSTLDGRSLFWPRGKMLGGYYDDWAVEGWTYEDLKPYFRKAEKFTPHVGHPLVDHLTVVTRVTGRLDIRTLLTPVASGSNRASKSEFHTTREPTDFTDINTPAGTIGVSEIVSHVDPQGQRSSTSTAYLPKSVLERPNLTVLIDTRITRLLFDTSNPDEPRAVGVEIAQSANGSRYRIAASKEVILSAGAIGTPQILLASGVGPKDVVEKASVQVLKESNHVGRNLYDHLLSCVIFRATESLDYLGTTSGSLLPLAKWLATGTGPLTSNLCEGGLFIRTDDPKIFGPNPAEIEDTTSGPNAPNLEMACAPLTFAEHGFKSAPPGEKAFTMAPVLLRPKSSGFITISSGNVWDNAVIEPNYFADPNDIKTLVQGVRLALKIAHTKPLADKLIFRPNTDTSSVFFMGDQDPAAITDAEIEAWLRREAQTIYHPVGTAKMGSSIENSVVDSQLRLSAHPVAGIVAIAERAADLIKPFCQLQIFEVQDQCALYATELDHDSKSVEYPTGAEKAVIAAAEELMEKTMKKYDPSHDAYHVNRVRRTALALAKSQTPQPDLLVVELAALLHDVLDKNTVKGNVDLLGDGRAELIVRIVENVSWSTEKKLRAENKLEPWHDSCVELHLRTRCGPTRRYWSFAFTHQRPLKTPQGRELGAQRHQLMLQFLDAVDKEYEVVIPNTYNKMPSTMVYDLARNKT